MSHPPSKIFEFGPYRLDTSERVLLRDGQPVPLTLKAFDLLLLLVENNGHIVEKDELMNRVWAGSFVEEGNLKVTVSMVRKALDDSHNGNRYVETVPRRGYRFVAEVKEVATDRVDLVLHERMRETVTIEEVAMVNELPPAQPRGVDRLWRKITLHKGAVAATGLLLMAISTATIFFSVKYVWPKLTARKSPARFENFKITPLT